MKIRQIKIVKLISNFIINCTNFSKLFFLLTNKLNPWKKYKNKFPNINFFFITNLFKKNISVRVFNWQPGGNHDVVIRNCGSHQASSARVHRPQPLRWTGKPFYFCVFPQLHRDVTTLPGPTLKIHNSII